MLSFNPFQHNVAFQIETRHDFQCNRGKVQYLVFSNFLLVLIIFLIFVSLVVKGTFGKTLYYEHDCKFQE